MPIDSWTDDSVTTLTKLWNQGLSCTEISAQMEGYSRNAIIGKIHRLKLKRTTGHENKPRKERPAPRAKRISSKPSYSSVFKSRERKPPTDYCNRSTGFVMVTSVLTGNPLMAKKRRPLQREMSKSELRTMLETAFKNTADMGTPA